MIYVGTAGWSIPKEEAGQFAADGAGLVRYAGRFGCVEINSTFKRTHRAATFARWAEAVPDDFRFSVKLPKSITHDAGLMHCGEATTAIVGSLALLGKKLGPLLVQLPPKLAFDPAVVKRFFADLRMATEGPVVCEPRHASWFTPEADTLLMRYRVARVAADPCVVPDAGEPGGHPELVYVRLHGAPRIYYSAYDEAFLDKVATLLHARGSEPAWCIFDNTASGAATGDALRLLVKLAALSADEARSASLT